ncbi:LysR family transcriptional regulator [Pusillimonas sp. CC-YST705]|uniref:LysR family transcriptional regulator n=1 Tax=Mesopusillimonas faecipullorum TaxID=2755040 RepID=A0ABS8CE11_9BURK|nr:LysR substrate-binding domain-containing protein [Mesopusillimonas faecipullorum]MCB5364271.1 LysR family transcriptional regulator [Mesopusillimonas faecipullorum]
MTFDRKELTAFLAVARLGSIGNAAATLALTQPAISRILSRLEDRLGAKLFVRHSTGMELNAFGRALLPHAELLEAEGRRVQEEIELLKGSATGLVRVGVVPSVALQLLPQAIQQTRLKAPHLHIHVVEGTGNQLLAWLLRQEVDFAITGLWNEPLDSSIRATPLFQDEICILARWDHPLTHTPQAGLAELLRYPWAIPERGNVLWTELNATFQRAGLEPPTAAVTANAIQTLKALVARSDFLSVMARVSFQLEEQNQLLRPLPMKATRWRRQLALLQRSRSRLLPAAQGLLEEIRTMAGGAGR